MADLEKVLNGLKTCVDGECAKCPYGGTCSDAEDFVALARDALEIIKEMQFCKPIMRSEHAHGGREVWYECNECGAYLGMYYGEKKVCKCGRKVAWE